jgi:two-component system response regulator PilR (NtrC family)
VIFVITAVVQLLRKRLVETEALAEQRGLDLRNLVELNEYIIQHLRESIVVVDDEDHVRLINESAVKHLGAGAGGDEVRLEALSAELANELRVWRSEANVERAQMAFSSPDGTNIQPHFAPLSAGRSGGVVIFLEDTSLIAERVQQAKLAALGRLSASIAHEIRNPLGAMSHAGQLLAESPSMGEPDHRLTDIIRVNARRVSQIVESVLALSRREPTHPERLPLNPWVEDFTREFIQTLELYEGAVSLAPGSPEIEVRMDPTHLHQILWNLCDNAVKYASVAAGAIAVELTCGVLEPSGRPFLEVADRGPGIKPDKVEQIFEPFYTGQPGGTGLGLYISRELAERNGATLRYQPRSGGGSAFRIVFADPSRWQSAMKPIALVVDDEPHIRELLSITLERMDIATRTCLNITSAKQALEEQAFDLCLTDMRLPDGDGLDLVEWIQREVPGTPVAVITAHGSVEAAVRALKLGAFDFVSKPLDLNDLRKLVTAALKLKGAAAPRSTAADPLVGQSPPIDRVRAMIAKVARSQAPVHISGESGTGKELVARMIHDTGPRSEGPFVPINCGAIPTELMESEFFGHKKGSFTGATSDKIGLIQTAEGGTLFLDEVADLPLHMQVKLLRVIQEKTIRPVGQANEIPVDVRILSATHKNLGDLVAEGSFREDLYYRINVIGLQVPPLRDRGEDVLMLAHHTLVRLASGQGVPTPHLTPAAQEALLGYRFPGNVRELENILERALTLCSAEQIDVSDLQLRDENHDEEEPRADRGAPLGTQLEVMERDAIVAALEQTRYNKTAAAKLLGLTFRALRYRIKKLGIE